MTHFKTIPLSNLQPPKDNPRHSFDEEDDEQLLQSVDQDGILQPVIVRPTDNGFEVVAGERRRRAASTAGLRDVPAVVRQLSDKEAYLISLKENLFRSELTLIEEAEAFLRLRDIYGWRGNEIARGFHLTDAYVYSMMQLASSCEALKESVGSGRIPKTVAYLIARIEDRNLQEQATLEAERMAKSETQGMKAAAHIRKTYLSKRTRSKSTERVRLLVRKPALYNQPDYVRDWISYLLNFSPEQFQCWQQICRRRKEVTVIIMAEAVEAVMIDERKAQAG